VTRYKLMLEYDGGGFVGWQRQANGLSLQEVLEEAAFRFCGERVTSHAAGRTDAGVHAAGQVAHLDIEKATDESTLRDALNFHMKPHPIVVLAAVAVDDGFHARFSAKARLYRYVILNRRAAPALERGRVWWVSAPLDLDAMQAGAALLIGQRDFSSFRAAECQARSPVKTLDRLDFARESERITLTAEARSFLHHQVRNMVGTLKLVGEGKWQPAEVGRILAARDRREAGPTAPADGLTLVAVRY
jgi:tRNA pseudouridine38-40 synthase